MSEYIMNRESLKRHCEAMCYKFKNIPTSGTYREHKLVLDLLEQIEWIPVSEKLPETDDEVLITADNGEIYLGFIYKYGSKSWYINSKEYHEPIAWMFLPKPYEPQESKKVDCSTCANANNVVVCPYTIKDIAAEEGCKFWHEAESEGRNG